MSQFPPQNERLFDRSRTRSGADRPAPGPALAWTALALAAVAVGFSVVGLRQGWYGLSSTLPIIGAFILAVIAAVRKAQPRWVAVTALALSILALLPTIVLILLTVMSIVAFLAR